MMLKYILLTVIATIVAGEPTGYLMVGEPIQISNGFRVTLNKVSSSSFWEGEVQTLTLDAEFQSNYRLRVKIYDASTPRFEVPIEILPPNGGSANPLYDVQFQNSPLFTMRIVRKSSGAVLFETLPEQEFIFADQYVTLAWKPATENVYGIGENEQPTFRHDFSRNITWALWGRDQPPEFTANMYGVHPHYTVLENDGSAHAVVIVNSNAQQFSMLDGPTVRYITTGGLLDFYFFLGPTPENTVQQYTEAVGRPQMPPYWGLGFQLCRFGYDKIETMIETVNRTAAYGIPQDVQYGDIDIMERALDFTYSQDRFPGLPEYIKELKTKGVKFVTILDPCISTGEDPEKYRALKLGNEMDVWVKKSNGEPVLGKVWPADPVYFPDYSNNATKQWWITLIKEFHDLLEYDGLWIDMNEPANQVEGDMNDGCAANNLNKPPYVPPVQGGSLISGTLCGDHVQVAGKHYDVHSLYGWFQSESTLIGAREGTGKRSMVLSRSTFLGSGRWVAHWLGDNWSHWDNLHFSIIGMLQFNQFGIPFAGADICGFLGDSTEEMCQRWMELGAFYPFSRNHNVAGAREQDPAVWGPAVAESSRNALLVRYTLLPFLYTLFYNSVTTGSTVVRALWHEFPTDPNTPGVDTQFMWGKGLLISPVLTEGSTSVKAYFPNTRSYDYFTGREEPTRSNFVTIHTPMDKINLHILGGNVIPTQEPAVNTQLSRDNPFGLIVALDDDGNANGELFFDDGDSIDTIGKEEFFFAKYSVSENTLSSIVALNGYSDMENKVFNTIRLLGAPAEEIQRILVNGKAHDNFEKLSSGEILITDLGLNPTRPFELKWE